jgi:predicted GNAT family N-acyltransferase
MIEVKRVTTEQELEAVFRFRYQVYVRDQSRDEPYADHLNKQLREPLDKSGWILGAYDNGKLIGTLRTNPRNQGALDGYESLYGIDRLPRETQMRASITTKLMVNSDRRGGMVAIRLAKLSFQLGLEHGVHFDFVDARDITVPLFEKLGHRVLDRNLQHPVYGRANLMRLNLLDAQHLSSINSPFLSIVQKQVI